MVGSNKILTVSYGTFSCTLEGFDDSFHSMKAIAEYFRDLAQEDRYFGAEPPAPDVEMLARIAEREISRRVEAEMKGGSVRLRAEAPKEATAESPAKETSPAETAPKAAAPADAEVPADVEPQIAEAPAAAPEIEEIVEPATEEAPLAAETAMPEAEVAETVAEAPATDVNMPPVAAESNIDADAAQAFMTAPQKSPALTVPPAPALYQSEAPAHPDENSVAAKLQRIRAVVSRAQVVAPAVALTEVEDIEDTQDNAPLSFHDDADAEMTAQADADLAKAFVMDDAPDEIEADAAQDAAPADEVAAHDVEDTVDAEEPVAQEAVAEEVVDTDESILEDAIAETPETEHFVAEDAETTAQDTFDADAMAELEGSVEADMADIATQDDTITGDVAEAAESTPEDVLETAPDNADDIAEDNSDADLSQPVTDADDIDMSDVTETTEAAWAREALSEQEVAEDDANVLADNDVLDAVTADLSSDLNDIDTPAEAAEKADDSDVAASVAAAVEEDANSGSLKKRIHARIVRLRKDGLSRAIPVATPAEDVAEDGITAALKADADAAETATDDPLVLSDAFEATAAQPEAADPEDQAHDDIRSAIAAAMPAGTLSDDDEEELQRELAAAVEDVVVLEDETPEEPKEVVIEDVAAKTDDTESAPKPDDMPEVVVVQSRGRKKLPEPDYAVTRMIAQTDEALNEPAGSRRRNAIAQLKAAVAATEAARQLGDKSNAAAEAQNAFRDDLDQVVRPSRPIETGEQDGQPADRPRASPLKLVASQRVDGAERESSRAMSKSVEASEPGGFAKFAASMGATELPDLLEAAAAYTSFVEGIEDFSRPQIMKKVQMTTTEEFSREDGLRSFGTLLRQGRISKVRNGRFQVSEQTRFRPDARSA